MFWSGPSRPHYNCIGSHSGLVDHTSDEADWDGTPSTGDSCDRPKPDTEIHSTDLGTNVSRESQTPDKVASAEEDADLTIDGRSKQGLQLDLVKRCTPDWNKKQSGGYRNQRSNGRLQKWVKLFYSLYQHYLLYSLYWLYQLYSFYQHYLVRTIQTRIEGRVSTFGGME